MNSTRTAIAGYRARWLPPLYLFVLVLTLWQVACTVFAIADFVLPSPISVGQQINRNFDTLLKHTGITILEAALGFLIANCLAFACAMLFTYSSLAQRSAYPYLVALQSVPIVALAPLITLWLGDGLASKVAMAALITFFPMVVNATVGLNSVDRRALDLMHVLKATQWQVMKKLRVPASVPYVVSALKISAPLAVVGAIVAEIAGAASGIGYLILVAAYKVQTSFMFACILFAALAGLAFFASALVVEHGLLNRRLRAHKREDHAHAVVRLLRHGEVPSGELAEASSLGIQGDQLKMLARPDDGPAIANWLRSNDLNVIGAGCVLASRLIASGTAPGLLEQLKEMWRDPDGGRNLDSGFAYGVRRHVMWRLLDDPKVSEDTEREIYEFVENHWNQWWRESAKWSAATGSIVDVMRLRLDEKFTPGRKAWIYLVAASADANKAAVLKLAQEYSDSLDPMVRRVARRIQINKGFFVKEVS